MRRFFRYRLLNDVEYDTLNNVISQKDNVIDKATAFIKDVEAGNLDTNLLGDISADSNHLAKSLHSMRDKMKRIREEEQKRNWVTQGLAKFVEILRVNNEDLKELAGNIISNLIKYMDANQGALFILNDDNKQDRYLEMVACYAYNRKKHLTKRIELGEGLTGQAFLEQETIYLTEVPKDFVAITSGLGEALPRNVLIVPLKVNEAIYGVVEIASFATIHAHQIEFVEKLGESIASTIVSVKTNQQTRRLLVETQQQAEQMRTQEEEMRQSMEELSATQEEMQRLLKAVQQNETEIKGLINVSSDSILTLDKDYKVVQFNTGFASTFQNKGIHITRGFDIMSIFSPEEVQKKRKLYERVFAGEVVEILDHLNTGGFDNYFAVKHAPLADAHGAIHSIAIFATDVTNLTKAKARAEQLAIEAQQQTEEVKAQEEELRQNMEELQATQEAMIRKQEEIDKTREENERIKQEEAERALKIGDMQKKAMLASTLKLKQKLEELQKMKEEMDKVKEAEANRALKISEIQKQAMNKLLQRLKDAEAELKKLKAKNPALTNLN